MEGNTAGPYIPPRVCIPVAFVSSPPVCQMCLTSRNLRCLEKRGRGTSSYELIRAGRRRAPLRDPFSMAGSRLLGW